MSERIPITKNGIERLKLELHHLMTVERKGIQKAIAEAREHGDLKENAEYHAAKERQGFIEGRIQELNAKMAQFQVVDPSKQSGTKITFGATVTMENVATEEITRYQIVGPDEANLENGQISFLSPIAKALIGKEEGDIISINVPKGKIEVEVTEIVYQ